MSPCIFCLNGRIPAIERRYKYNNATSCIHQVDYFLHLSVYVKIYILFLKQSLFYLNLLFVLINHRIITIHIFKMFLKNNYKITTNKPCLR